MAALPAHQVGRPEPKFGKGTTALGHIFSKEGGTVVAVDHPRLSSFGGFPENVVQLHLHLLAAFSGGIKDSLEYLLNGVCQISATKFEVNEGRKASAAEASEWLADFLSHHDSDFALSLGVLIAGWDNESGPSLYKVDGKGKVRKESLAATGSGSSARSLILGTLPFRRLGITLPDAKEIAKRAMESAKRAVCIGGSHAPEQGECISVFRVGSAGVELVVSNDDIEEWQRHRCSKTGRNGRTRKSTIVASHLRLYRGEWEGRGL